MSFYDDRVLPHLINLVCSTKPTRKQREKVVHLAEGVVLEIGFGSGLNLPDVDFIDLPGEEIPLEARSVDTVLVTFTLCSIDDAAAALEGMRRVLKPAGNLLFAEHGAAPDARVRRWQDRLNPGWKRVSGGCNMNRNIPQLIESTGFRVTTDERMYIPGPKILSYHYWGVAKP
jgi:SAM-dependent methyltransferase